MATYPPGVIDAIKPWTQSGIDAQRKVRQQVLKLIDELGVRKQDFFSTLGRAGKAVNNVIHWAERYHYSSEITGQMASPSGVVTFSGYVLGNTAVSEQSLQLHIQVGTIIERPSDGAQYICTVCDYANLTATFTAHGNTGAISADGAPVEYDIIGHATTDSNESHVPSYLDLSWRHAGTQRMTELFTYDHTWLNISPATELGIVDKVKDQISALTRKFRERLGRSVLRGSPTYDGGEYKFGDQLERGTMTGIFQWPRLCNAEKAKPNTYVNMSGAPITAAALNDLIFYGQQEEGCDYSEGDWAIVCDPVTREEISTFDDNYITKPPADHTSGLYISQFVTRSGDKFPIMKDRWVRKGTLTVVNKSECKWDYLQGCDVLVKELETQNMQYKKLLYLQAYAIARKPRQILHMYGMPTTK